jgi:hypothetical protein
MFTIENAVYQTIRTVRGRRLIAAANCRACSIVS